MQKCLILEFDRVEKEKGFKEEKEVKAVSRLLLFLPRLLLIALMAGLILLMAGLYYLSGEIPYVLPEASQVINFAGSSAGLIAMGTVLAMILFVFALRVISKKKGEILNDEQGNEADGSKMFQNVIAIEAGETPVQVAPLPIKKKALKKIYGKSREQKETKNEKKYRKKNKPNNKHKVYYPDYNSGQRDNVVMFRQKRPSSQRRAYRPITPRVATAANRIKWRTQAQAVNQIS